MLKNTVNPPKCRHCKLRTESARIKLHDDCIGPWVEAEKAKKARINASVDRALVRQYREKHRSISYRLKAAQREFNSYIRARDHGKPCICCSRPLGTGDVGGGFDCGHYRSTGSASHLRFDERNAHGQTKYCNRHGAGRAVDYRIGLIARIGREAVEALEADNRVHKWGHEELIEIKHRYRAKLKALGKGI